MIKGETAWRGGAGGEDYHHGQVILGRQPHKKQFGGQHPEFPQPQWLGKKEISAPLLHKKNYGIAPLFRVYNTRPPSY